VYSKKVEYLHQLVYQALDVIHDRKCAPAILHVILANRLLLPQKSSLHAILWRRGLAFHGIRQRQANNAAGGGKDKGQVDDDFYDEEEMFLRLDDVLEGVKHLCLRVVLTDYHRVCTQHDVTGLLMLHSGKGHRHGRGHITTDPAATADAHDAARP
jgi:hypothetical protein